MRDLHANSSSAGSPQAAGEWCSVVDRQTHVGGVGVVDVGGMGAVAWCMSGVGAVLLRGVFEWCRCCGVSKAAVFLRGTLRGAFGKMVCKLTKRSFLAQQNRLPQTEP